MATGTDPSGSGTQGEVTTSRKARKRPRSHSADPLQEEDFACPICFNIFEEVYSTVCGHSFCYKCIRRMLLQTPHCPMCKAGLPPQNPIHPNFFLNDLVAKYKLGSECQGQNSLEAINWADKEDLPKMLEAIQERLKKEEEREVALKHHVLTDFFLESQRRKEKELAEVKQQLKVIESDIEDLKSRYEGGSADSEEASRRKAIVHGDFTTLLQDYLSHRVPYIRDSEDDYGGGQEGEREPEPYEEFAETLDLFTRFSGLRELSSLNYCDQSNTCSIVSSIEFDRDGETFAVGGVSKKIKVYSFANLMHSSGFPSHFPFCEMTCQAKLSSIFFNPYHKNQLASSDYGGGVCIWDVNTSTMMANHKEHSESVWSVAYNPSEISMYASGSDDCTVKLWCTYRPHSVFTIYPNSRVCSVRFHPTERNYLACGLADRSIHYIDLRNPRQQLFVLKGHRKAVSYVQFINDKEIISASTDSELKLWNTQEGQVLRTYRGHTNDNRFVGLTVSDDFISCGSEDNTAYVYCKQVSKPMLKYKFNTSSNLLVTGELENRLHAVAVGHQQPQPSSQQQPSQQQPSQQQPSQQQPPQQQPPQPFVSSVCWKKNSNLILAGNSQGHIKLLEMC